MRIKDIRDYLKEISIIGFSREKGLVPENVELINGLYELAKQIKPYDSYRNGADRMFWLIADDEEEEFAWIRLYLAEHNNSRGIWIDRICFYDSREKEFAEYIDITPLLNWLIEAVRKCVEMIKAGTYTEYVRTHLPYRQRSGVVQLKTYWNYVPEHKEEWFRTVDQKELEEFFRWDANEGTGTEKMTTVDYFRACDCVYDLLNEKNDDPRNYIGPADTPRDRYIANMASVFDVDRFLALDETSPEEFADYILFFQESHVWEIDCGRGIELRPVYEDGRFFLELLVNNRCDYYGLRIHVELGLRRRGFPIQKSSNLLELLSGEEYIAIAPYSYHFDSKTARENGFETTQSVMLPEEECDDLIKEVTWLPIMTEWNTAISPDIDE